MRKIQVCLELDDDAYHVYEVEAERQGTTVQALVEQILRGLYHDLIEEEREGDHPIIFP